MKFKDYDLVIFDLDNTLYDENLYLFKGYLDLARYLSNKYSNIPFLECKMYLEETFKKEGRKFLFDKLFDKYKILDELEDCLKLMREVTFDTKIKLFKTSYLLLKDAINSTKVCVLTNGNPTQQKNKIRQIEWEGLLDNINIVFANEYAPKPSSKVFKDYIKNFYNINPANVLMIGDSKVDEEFAIEIGSSFINIIDLLTQMQLENINQTQPLVSITIPCRNEIKYISNLLNSILESDYDKNLIEVFVVDGMSDDGTRELIEKNYLSKYENIKILDNYKHKTPYAFNIGIKKSLGEIIIILGARHIISKNYISEVVECLSQREEIGCVGGVVRNIYENKTSEVISKAMASPFGIGFNNFRSITEDAYVDTIGSPAFRKSVFDEIGFFDENLTRNQDDDFSFRLIKSGYKILLKSSISIQYYVRASFDQLFKQFKQYGYWKVFVNKKHRTVTTLRQLFPIFFVLSFPLFFLLIFLNSKFIYIFLIEMSGYLVLNFIFAFRINKFDIFQISKQMYTCLILHVSYGLGYLEGVIDFLILNKNPNVKNETLSR